MRSCFIEKTIFENSSAFMLNGKFWADGQSNGGKVGYPNWVKRGPLCCGCPFPHSLLLLLPFFFSLSPSQLCVLNPERVLPLKNSFVCFESSFLFSVFFFIFIFLHVCVLCRWFVACNSSLFSARLFCFFWLVFYLSPLFPFPFNLIFSSSSETLLRVVE